MISSEVTDPSKEDGALDPVAELTELVELDPPMDEPDPELGTPEVLSDETDADVAIGVETLLVCVELGRGRAIVTGCGCCSNAPPELDGPGNCIWGRSREGTGGGLNFAVAGEIRTAGE